MGCLRTRPLSGKISKLYSDKSMRVLLIFLTPIARIRLLFNVTSRRWIIPDAANSSIPKQLNFVEPTGMYEVSNVVQLGMDSSWKMVDLMYSITSWMLLSEKINGAIGSMTTLLGFIYLM